MNRLLVAFLISSGMAVAKASDVADVTVVPSASRLWSTVTDDSVVLPVDWPAGAATARIEALPAGAFAGVSEELTKPTASLAVNLPRPATPEEEYVVRLSLRYYAPGGTELTGFAADASLAVVCTSVTFRGTDKTADAWTKVAGKQVVLPLPVGTELCRVTVAGEAGELPVAPPCLWTDLAMRGSKTYALDAVDAAGATLGSVALTHLPSGLLLLFR